jgi:hypothetical protein
MKSVSLALFVGRQARQIRCSPPNTERPSPKERLLVNEMEKTRRQIEARHKRIENGDASRSTSADKDGHESVV